MTNATAKATIHTNYGDIVVDLFGNHAPLTVENFIGLADGSRQWKHPRTGEIMNTPLYKDVVFHRIIKDFMIQGGDPLGMGVGGPGYQFKDEIHPELSFSKPYLAATPSSVRLPTRHPRRSSTQLRALRPASRTARSRTLSSPRSTSKSSNKPHQKAHMSILLKVLRKHV